MRKAAILLSALGISCLVMAADSNSRKADWRQVEEAVAKGLPKTAIKHLEQIIEQTKHEQAYAEAIKAIGRKVALEGTIQGNKPEEKITRLQAEITKSPEEMRPAMEAILAHWYWHYYQHNRWRFMQRTRTTEPPGEDFTTWGLPRLFAEIDQHYQAALKATDQLQATPIATYDDLLVKGNMPDKYRPTLYDFLAHEALTFYQAGEQAAARPEDAFTVSAAGPIFAPIEQFIAWQPESTDTDSPRYKAIRLYQTLLKFHAQDDDRSAFLDLDLGRLVFGVNVAFGEEKNARYRAALKRFAEQHAEHLISSRALWRLATVLESEGKLVEAHQVATQGKNRHPKSVGGRGCFNVIQQIESKELQVVAERVWAEPWPTIDISYRNVTKVYFRAIPYTWEKRLLRGRRPDQFSRKERQAMLQKTPALAWSVDLPATADYQQRRQQIPAPKDLKPGAYLLYASADQSFSSKENVISVTDFWVSSLAIVVRNRQGQSRVEGFVLDAASGEPIVQATVRAWYTHRKRGWVAYPAMKTDEHGLFRMSTGQQRNVLLLAQHGRQRLAVGNGIYAYDYKQTQRPTTRTLFFTDRSLYRPGQTVQYKGLAIRVDQQADSYQTIANQPIKVTFRDPNNKEIASQQHQTNDYGSFSGSFTAPRDRLMGQMRIQVQTGPSGSTNVRVEEYKRPKFRVEVAPPATPGKLGGQVQLTGQATAYTGAALDGAKVRWRVVREVRYPVWWHWRYWWYPRQNQSQEIAHGTAQTGADGSFPLEFLAQPDRSVPAEQEPTFHFTIYADVTDTTGETRSAQRTIRLGYTALQATVSTGSWLVDSKPVVLRVVTNSLDGTGQVAEGGLKIYRLRQPEQVARPALASPGRRHHHSARMGKAKPDLSNIHAWPLGDVVHEQGFTTDATGSAQAKVALPAGAYRALLTTQDRFGKPVSAELPFQVLDPEAARLKVRVPYLLAAPRWAVEPGQAFEALWGTGYERGRAFIEIEHRGKVLSAYWTKPQVTQAQVKHQVTEAMRGGFTVRVTMVRENRAYLQSRQVHVPWTNKSLAVRWERFRSKLEPGAQEKWTAVVTGPDAKGVVAEMVATLYDASLDAYLPHHWQRHFGVFRHDRSNLQSLFENRVQTLQRFAGHWRRQARDVSMRYRALPPEVIANLWGWQFGGRNGRVAPLTVSEEMAFEGASAKLKQALASSPAEPRQQVEKQQADGTSAGSPPDLSKVSARRNLNETAFFFPHLISDKNGQVRLEFTMPEALTEWRLMGFAHDAELRAGFLQGTTVTAKDLMVQPNPPRFVREGDELEFTVKVSNQSTAQQTGQVRLTLSDARTGQSVDQALGLEKTDLTFELPAKSSKSFSWRLKVPDGMGFLTYQAVASSGRLSDGEEGYLPVLARRILVTESLPLPVRGPETKTFVFEKLRDSAKSDSLEHQALTVQMVSNPAWYAVMALPYLMEYPHQCNEQVFNRLYANALARHITQSDPKIHRIFDVWRNTPGDAFDSPLEKNQDLKAVMLEETPWRRQAKRESQARRNVGILFDDNRLNGEIARALAQLAERQRPDGAWSWFPGGPTNDYITLYITTGFGRLRHLGVDVEVTPAIKALQRLDDWLNQRYRRIKNRELNHLSSTVALYLYGRSFFLKDRPIGDQHRKAVDYYLGQARKFWLQLANRQSQAHLAIALTRFGDEKTPQAIMRSIVERSVTDDELGMFWRDTELSWWWYRAPIETQAMMIEALDEVLHDAKAVEACKVWLLKQKQTQDWKTTKATADAVYALLLRGENLLASDALVEVKLAGETIEPKKVEAGTGFYEKRFTGVEVKPEMADVKVTKTDKGVAWGSVHWQYLEDMSKVTPYEGTPLKLEKAVYVRRHSKQGPRLEALPDELAVGDELVMRITLRVDRDMEYVHLKDQRPSGTEPTNVLSQYKFQDGLYYYETTRDTASHFFIDYLPKGTYVFEYPVRVQHRGEYQTGMAQIQSMYAPEFNSHSASVKLRVR